MTLRERLKALGARDILVIVLFAVSVPVSVLSLLELIGFRESAEANPYHLCAHWTTLAALVFGLASPLLILMIGRRSLAFAYVYLLAVVHLLTYMLFWTWLSPAPQFDLGTVRATLVITALAAAGLSSAAYFVRTSRAAGERQKLLSGWKAVAAATACAVLLALSYHRLTLQRHHFVQGYLYRASRKVKVDDWDGAIAEYDACLARWPEEYTVHLRRALANDFRGDHAAALADSTSAVEASEWCGRPYAGAYFCRARLRSRERDYDGCIADCTRAIEVDETSGPADSESWITPRAYLLRGVVRAVKGDNEAAAADLRKVLELSTNAGLVEKAQWVLKSAQDAQAGMPEHEEVW